MRENIWDRAKAKGIITNSQLREALERQRNEGGELEFFLFETGALDEDKWVEFLVKDFGCRMLDLDKMEIDEEAVRIIPARVAKKLFIIPVRKARDALAVSMLNPLNSNTIKIISQVTDYEILPFVSKKTQIEKAIEAFYAGRGEGRLTIFPVIETMEGIPLKEEFTFEKFVVDRGNEFGYSLALAVAKSYNENYNPLFIWGDVGLGKTHLLNAIGNYVKNESTDRTFSYATAKRFVSGLLTAIQENTLKEFQDRYGTLDLLLLDDVEFLIGRERTQEEFFHIFDLLRHRRCQIVLTSDRPPDQLTALAKRLTSRFASGVVVEIKEPDFETKMAILKKRAEDKKIPDEVIEYIAKKGPSSVRALLGLLHKVITLAEFKKEEVSLSLTKEIISTSRKKKKTTRKEKELIEESDLKDDTEVDETGEGDTL